MPKIKNTSAEAKTQQKCIWRKSFSANKQKVESQKYELKAFCIHVHDDAIRNGYIFLKNLHAGKFIISPSEFGLKSFRINLYDHEKEKITKV